MFIEYDFTPRKPAGRILFLTVITILILFGTHTHALSLAAFLPCALVVVFDKTHFKLMMMVYLMMFAHVFKISASGMSYFTFLMFLYIGVKVVQEKRILWSAVFFILYMVIVQVIRSHIAVTDDIKLIGNILFVGCSLGEICGFSDDEKESLSVTYIMAVIMSSFVRFFDSSFFRISSYTDGINVEGYGAGQEEIVRFAGLYDDPNYYSINLLVALCLIVILYYRGKTPIIFCALSATMLLYFGTLTYSKSFLLILMIPLTMFLYANHRIGRYDVQVISLALIAAAILVVLLIHPHYISNMVRRVESRDSITTGRADIWLVYLDCIYTHPDIMLFGAGIGAAAPYSHVVHNFYLECLYHLGIIGCILLTAVIISSFIQYKRIARRNLMNYSVLSVILVSYFFLCQLHGFEFPIHYMLMFTVLNHWALDERECLSTSVIDRSILPEPKDGEIKTLFPMEDHE